MEQKFYICKHCGNIIAKVKDTGVPVICCGEPMNEIIPGTTTPSRAISARNCIPAKSLKSVLRSARVMRLRRSTHTATSIVCGKRDRSAHGILEPT